MMLLLPILSIFIVAAQARNSRERDAVRLDSIQALTFRRDKPTTARRVSSIPQLNCVGGSGKGLFEPDTVRCKNAGSSYSTADIEWTCTAALPPEFKLGSTDVVCEGYNSPEDDFILRGSCGLEYRLVLTPAGEEKYGKPNWWGGRSGGTHSPTTSRSGREAQNTGLVSDAVSNIIFFAIFGAVALFIVYSAWTNNANATRQRRQPRPNFGGGGRPDDNDDDDNDPPPPYTASPRNYRKASSRSAPASQPESWRPGFWSGLAAGAAGGYYAGNRTQNRQQRQAQDTGSWFGGGGGGRHVSYDSPYGSGEGSSRNPGGFSSDRYDSTGFGGTRRR